MNGKVVSDVDIKQTAGGADYWRAQVEFEGKTLWVSSFKHEITKGDSVVVEEDGQYNGKPSYVIAGLANDRQVGNGQAVVDQITETFGTDPVKVPVAERKKATQDDAGLINLCQMWVDAYQNIEADMRDRGMPATPDVVGPGASTVLIQMHRR